MTTLAEYYNNNPLTLKVDDLEQNIYTVLYNDTIPGVSFPIINRVLVTITGDPENGDFAGKKVEIPFFLTDGDGVPKEMAIQQYKRFLLVALGSHYTEDWDQDNENLKDLGDFPLKLVITKRDFKGREITNVVFEYNHGDSEMRTSRKTKVKTK